MFEFVRYLLPIPFSGDGRIARVTLGTLSENVRRNFSPDRCIAF